MPSPTRSMHSIAPNKSQAMVAVAAGRGSQLLDSPTLAVVQRTARGRDGTRRAVPAPRPPAGDGAALHSAAGSALLAFSQCCPARAPKYSPGGHGSGGGALGSHWFPSQGAERLRPGRPPEGARAEGHYPKGSGWESGKKLFVFVFI